MLTIVYDSGALLAAEHRNPDFLALHDELTAARIRPLRARGDPGQARRGDPPPTDSYRMRVTAGATTAPAP